MKENKNNSSIKYWLIFTISVVVVFGAGIFTASIIENRSERVAKLQPVTTIADWEPRNEIWGENYPKEYESYRKTLDTNYKSAHGGSAKTDYLEEFPELVVMWAGYGFSKDYNQGRGHGHAIRDIRNTLRTGGFELSTMPATCWTCKSTDVPRLMDVMGIKEFYDGTWEDLGSEVVNPIGCQDCHDNETMNLRISRPALLEAFEKRGKTDFTHQEMRSLVCAQCHVEYYFKKPGNYLTFPWDEGFSADAMERYYDNLDFVDWTHKLSKAPMLKAQHPDYELYMTGVHAERGVACADCHMPYKTEGGVKFTDHHIGSPLQNVSGSCQNCHRESEEQLIKDVYKRQNKVLELRRMAEKTLAATHMEAKIAWDNGATEDEMKDVLTLIRHAQWRWDWVAAANGVGFHSPNEALRVLGTSIQKAEQARAKIGIILTSKGLEYPVQLADISTKEKAQEYIGLDMEDLRERKEKFKEVILPEWDKEAKKRQGTLIEY